MKFSNFDLRLQLFLHLLFLIDFRFSIFRTINKLHKPQNIFLSFRIKTDKYNERFFFQMHLPIAIDKWQKNRTHLTVFQEEPIWSNWMIWQEREVNHFFFMISSLSLWVCCILYRYLTNYFSIQVLDLCLPVFHIEYLEHVINNNKIEGKTECQQQSNSFFNTQSFTISRKWNF